MVDEGLLRHDPGGARRIRARRRCDPGSDLLGDRAAAGRAGAGGDRADLVRHDAERVCDRERDPPDPDEVHLAGGSLPIHQPGLLRALGAVRGRGADRRRARCTAVRVLAAVHRRGPDLGRGQGMSLLEVATLLDAPHHDGSEFYADGRELRVWVPRDVDTVLLRYVEDGEGRALEAQHEGDGWW